MHDTCRSRQEGNMEGKRVMKERGKRKIIKRRRKEIHVGKDAMPKTWVCDGCRLSGRSLPGHKIDV
eukprot:scaffold46167_cov16-Tisochrysis_lutea.AAC.1